MATTSSKRWLAHHQPRPLADVRLFCFPYAGGSALVYRGWAAQLPSSIEVCPVQLPGRFNRAGEPALRSATELVRLLATELAPELDKPFAFFGHSMGAFIAFELARLLERQRGLSPRHLFASGRRAPQLPEANPRQTSDLGDAEFVAELRRLQGTPKEVLDNPELMELAMPLLRADFKLCERYEFAPGPLLRCPVTAFGGLQDLEVGDAVAGWRAQTTGPFALHMLPGDHFFIQSQAPALIAAVGRALTGPAGSGRSAA
jgi:medium-chain acyl-[acyl-carrier-protein] hydrolase